MEPAESTRLAEAPAELDNVSFWCCAHSPAPRYVHGGIPAARRTFNVLVPTLTDPVARGTSVSRTWS